VGLEEWADVIGDMRALLLWRPCREVVGSIVRRTARTDDPIMQLDATTAICVWIAYNRRVCEYRRLYPDDAVLVGTASLVANAPNVHKLICDRLRIDIDFVPITDLFDSDLLTTSETEDPSGRVDLGALAGEVAEVEEALLDLSDL
jgi:hypothetical protein